MPQSLLDRKNHGEGSPRIMIMGGPKTGKTTLIGSLAKQYKLLWLDLDDNTDVLTDNLSDTELSNIQYIQIKDTATNPIASEVLLNLFEYKKDVYICDDHSVINCKQCITKRDNFFIFNPQDLTLANGWIIVVDGGSQYSDSALNRVLLKSKINLEDAANSKDDRTTFGVWMAQGAYVHRLLGTFKNGKWAVCMTAHELECDMPDKTKKLVPNMGTTKQAPKVSGYFTNVIRTYKVNGNFKIDSSNHTQTQSDVGGQREIDLNKPGTCLADYFKRKNTSSGANSIVTPKLGANSNVTKPVESSGSDSALSKLLRTTK